jgi:ElaB/YqjD/DUF883 family membrane-anchored ribosome-binding protein
MAANTRSKTEAIQDQVSDVTDEVAALAAMLKDLAASTGEDLRGAAGEKLAEISRRSQALADRAKAKAQSEIASLEKAITEKPVQSALIALVVGLVLGALLRR